ncbi:kinase-like domain-containing protein [Massariosphaeria phaeospora]|uniref:ethanolamine kinase n=1 Tax=Massariosphaeria phaeospora TaxID=100035 RepID=A0A7C8I6X9_9PLEO|nr:kinase-like domain-containing protein [Massariosphaeria phaeospora]
MGGTELSPFDSIRYLPLYYDSADSHNSALHLILTLRPEWNESRDTIEFIRFTEGITNTLLKAVNKLPGLSETEIDNEAILLRAYGKGTDVLIDREKETSAHSLLARHRLAPALLARFDNGLLYKYIQGRACAPADLRRPEVWRGVAQRLGEWHATLPISSISSLCPTASQLNGSLSPSPHSKRASLSLADMAALTPGMPVPNLWTTMQKWMLALPSSSPSDTSRRDVLQKELQWLAALLADTPGVAGSDQPFVFAHCDLLSGNVIIEPEPTSTPSPSSASPSRRSSASDGSSDADAHHQPTAAAARVSFIDYEYTSPAPAAFDLANHFAEWGGFDCDVHALPTRRVRRAFLRAYLHSYSQHLHPHNNHTSPSTSTTTSTTSDAASDSEPDLDALCAQVDAFRGVPGFYWGVWALIQAQISLIEFDYKGYAEVRLGEYWAWKREESGERGRMGEEMPERERRWARDGEDE